MKTPTDEESKESPAKEKKEVESGEEYTESEGVKVPEEIQKECHALISKCKTRECLDYVRSAVSNKENDMRKSEMNKDKKNKVPDDYSIADMPA